MQTPLPTLLSQALVAFTIEFDNEFEHRMPHRTTISKSVAAPPGAPWLVSLAMYSNFMQFVGGEGVTVNELKRRARVAKPSLSGMKRWGYVTVGPDSVIRPTAAGRRAKEIWQSLFGVIQERFGKDKVDKLRDSLRALITRFDMELPDYLPILGYGLTAEVYRGQSHAQPTPPHLPALLSKVLLAFTIEFERKSDLSLAISANVIRLLDEKGVRTRDLPRISGVSKEAIKTSISFLEKHQYVLIEPSTKLLRLTPKGRQAQDDYRERLAAIEEDWLKRFGNDTIRHLRNALEGWTVLEPYPDGWRASIPKPDTLPHYPMVLHRGGFPDGA